MKIKCIKDCMFFVKKKNPKWDPKKKEVQEEPEFIQTEKGFAKDQTVSKKEDLDLVAGSKYFIEVK